MRLLVISLALVAAASAYEVQIRYSAPVLGFVLKTTGQERIGGVVFNYVINNVAYQARGIQTSDGWLYRTRDVKLDGADAVHANAQIYDVSGNLRLTTQRSVLKLSGERTDLARLPSRQIRAATIFRDDFNSFDANKWNYEVSMYGGMNWEFQVYTNDKQNVFTRNGQLYLKPTFTVDDPRFDENFLKNGKMDMTQLFGVCTQSANYGCSREGKYGLLPPVMSGKVKSVPTLKYGTVEVRARIPKGDWLWPAIWMLPRDNKYGGWPRSGEIDIMESRGNAGPMGVGTVTSTLHWGTAWDQNRYSLTHGEKKSNSWHDSFHTWRLDWSPDHLITFIDDQQIMAVYPPSGGFWQKGGFSGNNIWGGNKMAPFDQEFYMIFNVAVGGTNGFFPDGNLYPTTKPWKNSSPHAAEDFWTKRSTWDGSWQGDNVAMIIDYVEFKSR
ncbi:beta-1,3-glucan-binding protein [Aplysia californica]|uniref:Beta-1,3-glucan-binding protein n=1 Tax=Aplysia californica TaxID=6500 RepID=A0ABM1ACL6_APLCA|nr:beta-1,3-glucan-binding protein [Aplysia californica]